MYIFETFDTNEARRFFDMHLKAIKNETRHQSWEWCYRSFGRYDDEELLTLHLAGYLASWGMYRGSSQLLKTHSYMIHKKLIPILRKDEYKKLRSIKNLTEFEEALPTIFRCYKDIEEFYEHIGVTPTKTLVTKIMLGVYGCVPAYDINFCNGLRRCGIEHSGNPENCLRNLCSVLKQSPEFMKILYNTKDKEEFKTNTLMKLIDIFFYQVGIAEKNEQKSVAPSLIHS